MTEELIEVIEEITTDRTFGENRYKVARHIGKLYKCLRANQSTAALINDRVSASIIKLADLLRKERTKRRLEWMTEVIYAGESLQDECTLDMNYYITICMCHVFHFSNPRSKNAEKIKASDIREVVTSKLIVSDLPIMSYTLSTVRTAIECIAANWNFIDASNHLRAYFVLLEKRCASLIVQNGTEEVYDYAPWRKPDSTNGVFSSNTNMIFHVSSIFYEIWKRFDSYDSWVQGGNRMGKFNPYAELYVHIRDGEEWVSAAREKLILWVKKLASVHKSKIFYTNLARLCRTLLMRPCEVELACRISGTKKMTEDEALSKLRHKSQIDYIFSEFMSKVKLDAIIIWNPGEMRRDLKLSVSDACVMKLVKDYMHVKHNVKVDKYCMTEDTVVNDVKTIIINKYPCMIKVFNRYGVICPYHPYKRAVKTPLFLVSSVFECILLWFFLLNNFWDGKLGYIDVSDTTSIPFQ